MVIVQRVDWSKWFSWMSLGVSDPETASVVAIMMQVTLIGMVAWLLTFIARKWISLLIAKVLKRTKTRWNTVLLEERFFQKFFNLIPPIFIDIAFKTIYGDWKMVIDWHRLLVIWILLVVGFILVTVLDVANKIYQSYPISKDRPLNVFIQVAKIFIFSALLITCVSIFIGESPRNLLVGLGAFAAVLLLIFKDSILGFVAGVQLLANKMIRIGDWIVMPTNQANGLVLEINLYTVKVQNWDMTITTIPTYQLVSQSFTNWRGMEESGGRRIMRWVLIDMQSVHFLSREEIDDLRKSEILKGYIETILPKMDEHNKGKESVLDESRLTNLGVFRQYATLCLQANQEINAEMTCMVRQLQPTATGIPLEIYCFSRNKNWVAYEKIQADIFDHLLAVITYFNLKIFQYPDQILVNERGENKS